MKKSLVIVESPSKAKTITKFLGKNFSVKASVGHIRDLPEKELGIDIEKGFKPQYVAIARQKKVIGDLKKAARASDTIYIATDPDREGEAIAWHIAQEIGNNKKIFRAQFNEITEKAVQNSISNPLSIDGRKVDAQQARRVLDRLVGYKVSPILWKTLYRGPLSAGRVQSVALKLICDRDKEHTEFKPEEYWTIHVVLETPDAESLTAKLTRHKGKKCTIPDRKTSDALIREFRDAPFSISSIVKKKVRRNPYPPFITSTLQQDAANRLGFSPSKTMKLAQQLYEGLRLGSEGNVSLITYMRTDSARMSSEALTNLRTFIREKYGSDYLPSKARTYTAKKKSTVQDAHECIRPTYFTRPPGSLETFLTPDQKKLYSLIWNRAVASQMESALFNQTAIKISADDFEFQANGSEQVFTGFLILWEEFKNNNAGDDDGNGTTAIPPGLAEGMNLRLTKTDPAQHFTKPPPRYNDSSLVKELDQRGIGRPSTYAQIVRTLIEREYVVRDKRSLIPTDLGRVVKDIVITWFPAIFTVDFTAHMEEELDQIEAGSKKYLTVIQDFYKPFSIDLDRALGETRSIKKSLEEKTGISCPECGSELVTKWSKNGKFHGCSAFPKCTYTQPFRKQEAKPPEKAGFSCEKCGSDMVIKTGRYGQFYACSAYPKCRNIVKMEGQNTGKRKPPEKAGFSCEKCGRDMVVRVGKRGRFYACSGYPECRNTAPAARSAREPQDST